MTKEKQKDSFIFYRSFFQAINDLPETNQLEIFKAISSYALDFEEPDLSGLSKTIFTLIKPQLTANNKRYLNGCKGADHGKKGGRPRTPEKPLEEPLEEPLKNPKKTPSLTPNKNVNENENENDNEEDKKIIIKKAMDEMLLEESKKAEERLKDKIKIPEWINSENWNEWMRGRKKKKFSSSPLAIKKIINALNRFEQQGYTHEQINKSLERSMMNNYGEVYEPRTESPNNSKYGVKF